MIKWNLLILLFSLLTTDQLVVVCTNSLWYVNLHQPLSGLSWPESSMTYDYKTLPSIGVLCDVPMCVCVCVCVCIETGLGQTEDPL